MSRYASRQVSAVPWVLVLLSALAMTPTSAGESRAASAAPTCFGREITLMGTPGPDIIRGTAERDSIWGGRVTT